MSPPRKKAASRKKTSVRKSPGRTGALTTTRKPAAAKAGKKKATGKSTARKATTKKKPILRAGTAKSSGRKRAALKPSSRKAAAKKSTGKKSSSKKSSSKKSTGKKSGSGTGARAATTKSSSGRRAPHAAARHKAPPRPPPIKRQAVPAPATARVRKITAKQIEALRPVLEAELVELKVQMEELQENSEVTQSELSGEVGLDEDFADAGTATFDRERDFSIRRNVEDLIDQVSRALARIDDGSYGICERCGKPIDAVRLRALPHASLCMDCKRRDERAR